MATWTAQVFVDSSVGEITATVEAGTYHGAIQQIERIYGPVQQITNVRESYNRGGGGGSSASGGGCLPVLGLLALVIIGGVASTGGDDDTPTESPQYAPVERVQSAPAPVAPAAEPQFRDYASPPPSYCITENFEPC